MDLPVAILGRLDDNFEGIEGKMRCKSVPENGADADCGTRSRLRQVEPGAPTHPLALSPRPMSFIVTHDCIF